MMPALDPLYEFLLVWHTPAVFHRLSQIQGVLWTAADLVLVWAALKLASTLRAREGQRPPRVRWALWWLSLAASPLLPLAGTRFQFFLAESLVAGVHYMVLVYTVAAERKRMVRLIEDYKSRRRRTVDASARSGDAEFG
jgi:hypothetical protein